MTFGSSLTGSRPSTPVDAARSSTSMSRRRSRTYERPCGERLTPSEAQWFLSLPDRARKVLFSDHEQAAMIIQCEDVLQKLCLRSVRRLKHLQQLGCTDEDAVAILLGRKAFKPVYTEPALVHDVGQRKNLAKDNKLQTRSRTFPDADQPKKGGLKRRCCRRTRSSSILRSSSSAPRREVQSESTTMNDPEPMMLFARPSQDGPKPRTRSQTTSSSDSHDMAQSTGSKPKYYQDPEARLKLKTYFSSEQKFDELLRFGFPASPQVADEPQETDQSSTSDAQTHSETLSGTESRRASETYTRFMQSDNHSVLSDVPSAEFDKDGAGSDRSSDDFEGPATPVDTTDTYLRYAGQLKSKYSVVDITRPNSRDRELPPLPPLPPPPALALAAPSSRPDSAKTEPAANANRTSPVIESSGHKPSSGASNERREMTLKISLTRPDLRQPETAKKSGCADSNASSTTHSRKSSKCESPKKDPLALQELPVVSDNVTGAYSPFAAPRSRLQENAVAKLWSRLARR